MLQPNLKYAATTLASSVEEAMISLYDLQTSVINANGQNSPQLQETFAMRKHLKDEWECIRIFLQQCHGFGSDVIVLKDSLGTENIEDCLAFLKEMSSSSIELLKRSKELAQICAATVDDFGRNTPALERMLKRPARRPPQDFPARKTKRNQLKFSRELDC